MTDRLEEANVRALRDLFGNESPLGVEVRAVCNSWLAQERAIEAARRLKEAEAIDARMGYPLPGDCALAVYLNTLDEALTGLDSF